MSSTTSYGGLSVAGLSVADGPSTSPPAQRASLLASSLASSLASLPLIGSFSPAKHRDLALDVSLYTNILILGTKAVAFFLSGSLSVLAALMDSALDILSQVVLYWAERRSSNTSPALYPAGASKFEPVGVIICAALMGMGSFQVIRESIEHIMKTVGADTLPTLDNSLVSIVSMIAIILFKLVLWLYCRAVKDLLEADGKGASVSTIDAMAQDHINDCLSNAVAVVAVVLASYSSSLWWVDPVGAIFISLYIMWSWYETGSEEIEKIVGKAADEDMITKLKHIGDSHHEKLSVDILRCYHFGEQFLVEMEVILPAEMVLKDTHDIGMSLQYKLEQVPEVERAFVHIDYKARPYDEHVNSRQFESYQQQQSFDQEVERTGSPVSATSGSSNRPPIVSSLSSQSSLSSSQQRFFARVLRGLLSALSFETSDLDVTITADSSTPLSRREISSVRISFSRLGFSPLRLGGLSSRDALTLPDLSLDPDVPHRAVTTTVDEAFKAIDVDRSGKLDRAELARALAQIESTSAGTTSTTTPYKSPNP
ncbi:hypothetical protein TeGR_g4714, partial [Tetraparma gracilis]